MNIITQKLIFSLVAIFVVVFGASGIVLFYIQYTITDLQVIQNFRKPVKNILFEIHEELSNKYSTHEASLTDNWERWKTFIEPKAKALNELRYLHEQEKLSTDIEQLLDMIKVYEKKATKSNFEAIRKKLKALYLSEVRYQEKILGNFSFILNNIFYVVILAILSFMGMLTFIAVQTIAPFVKSLELSENILHKIARGELIETDWSTRRDFNELVLATQQVSDRLNEVSNFAQSIGEGRFDYHFEITSPRDVLGKSLLQMREKLQILHEEEKKRSWAAEGYNQIAEILRLNNQANIEQLCQALLSFIVEYLEANQGGFFVRKPLQNNKIGLELMATYAYHKQKFVEKMVIIDGEHAEGLLGQAYISQKTILLTEIPPQYALISSGLGKAKPNTLLIIPLKYNEKVEAVIELAGFHKFEKHQINFLERISESIASALTNVQNQQHTNQLLQELKTQTSILQQQEETMKANLQELQIAQEQTLKAEKEREKALKNMQRLANIVETHPDFIGYFSMEGTIEYINPAGIYLLGYRNLQQIIGKNIDLLYPQEAKKELMDSKLPQAVQNKNIFYETMLQTQKGTQIPVEQFIIVNYSAEGKAEGFSLAITNITERKQKEQEIERYQKTLLNILDKIPGKIFLKDAQGKMLLANSEVARVYNRSVENLLGTSDFDFFEHNLAQSYRDQELEIMELGAKTYIQEEELTGELRYLQTTKMPFFIDYKQETGLLGIQYDITENVLLEKAVKELKQENRKMKQQMSKK